MESTKLTNTAYTIGWICALEVELAAAQALLDEEHPDLPLQPGDSNTYTLGRIGSHNVAVACLPRGSPGIGQAAIAATNLVRSFPNIRFSLMVGVGGGVPSNGLSDVRLGDVVVSTPMGTHGGVIQYDMGKTVQDILGAAASRLSARMRLKGCHEIHELVDEMAKTYPESGFECPGSERDLLFKSDYLHGESRDTCLQCDRAALVERQPRLKAKAPVIHYGLIGSANQVVRDAMVRDELGKIMDYCDSHKHKDWQPFAAAIASAYVKKLLENIAAVQVAQTELATNLIREKVDQAIESISKLTTRQDQLDVDAVLDWISPPGHFVIQDYHERQRVSNTGQWLLESTEFGRWIGKTSETLFLHGGPGIGKTMLSSIVVDFVQGKCFKENTSGLGFIYLDYGRQAEQDFDYLWANLLRQFLRHVPNIPEEIKKLYAKCKKNQKRLNLDELRMAMQLTVANLTQSYIIVDALDECQKTRSTIVKLVSEMFELQRTYGTNILVTSRQIPDIRAMFHDYPMLEIRATNSDIDKYIDFEINDFPPFVTENAAFIKEIKTGIMDSACGMFLLAKLHTETLFRKTTQRDLRKTLSNLAGGETAYTTAYTSTMERICDHVPEQKDSALLVLTYIVHAQMPLRIAEILHALAVEIDGSEIYKDGIPDQDRTISACYGLVVVEHGSQIVRLSHLTVREYLVGSGARWLAEPHSVLMRTCLKYLSLKDFGSGACGTTEDLSQRISQFPFYQYAAHFWGEHAALTSDYTKPVQEFLESQPHLESMMQVVARRYNPSYDLRSTYQRVSRLLDKDSRKIFPCGKSIELHLVAAFGLTELVSEMLQALVAIPSTQRPSYLRTPTIDTHDQNGLSAIQYATRRGHADVVKLLIDAKANLSCSPSHASLLMEATQTLNAALVRVLLEAGDTLDVSKKDRSGRTALHYAALFGQSTIVTLLLDHGADRESKDETGHTPLLLAAELNRQFAMRLLLAAGADYDTQDNIGQTPLFHAIKKGNPDIVLQLLNAGAQIDLPDNLGRTPLVLSAKRNASEIIPYLIDRGAQYNARDKTGRTPLSHAAQHNALEAAQLLLSKGALLEQGDDNGRTPLSWATEAYGDQTFSLLLAKDAHPHSLDNKGRGPLSYAAAKGNVTAVEFLLQTDRGLQSILSLDRNGMSPLYHAIAGGNYQVLLLLLRHCGVPLENDITHPNSSTMTGLETSEGVSYMSRPEGICTACGESIPPKNDISNVLDSEESMAFQQTFECLLALIEVRCHYATPKSIRAGLRSLCHLKRLDDMRLLLQKCVENGNTAVIGDPAVLDEYFSGRYVDSNDSSFSKLWYSAVCRRTHYIKLLMEYSDSALSSIATKSNGNFVNHGEALGVSQKLALWTQAHEIMNKYLGIALRVQSMQTKI